MAFESVGMIWVCYADRTILVDGIRPANLSITHKSVIQLETEQNIGEAEVALFAARLMTR
jgi:hypothetical protein